jgi:tetratricopeptide (TPR) repeat protein
MKTFILLFLLAASSPAFCQISFERLTTWEDAAKRARSDSKLIFLHLEDNKCQQCKEVAAKGFESADLKEKFTQNFVSLKANMETESGRRLAEKFGIKNGPVSLFIDPNGNILNRFPGSTSAGFVYSQQADLALGRRGGKQLTDYVKEYERGARSSKFMEEYILKCRQAALPVDDLLDQYVGRLPVDSLDSFRIVKFIYSQGPSLDSRAYKIIQVASPRVLIDSIYKFSPLAERVAINDGIITSSYKKAVQKNDRNLAYQTNAFVQNSYGKDFRKGSLAGSRHMVRFYLDIQDTVAYFREATSFLDRHHMRITADSLKKLDQQELRNSISDNPASKQPQTFSVRSVPHSQFFHMDLNEHAWHFYEMSDKVSDLEKALVWSYQSQEFFNSLNRGAQHPMRLGNPSYIDTYAQILYKLGRRDEAIEWQTKAVEAQDVTGTRRDSFAETLAKMKAGESLK